MRIQYTRATTIDELEQILRLQKKNASSSLSFDENEKEGFVSISHSLNVLKRMNNACPHIIAKDSSLVVGYALAMPPIFRNEIPMLTPMFETVDVLLAEKKYIVMGQVCIDKNYRKKGIFKGMYSFYKEQLQNEYDCLLTKVATENSRSLNAHLSVGFQILKTQTTNDVSWELLCWFWNSYSSNSHSH